MSFQCPDTGIQKTDQIIRTSHGAGSLKLL